LAGGIAELAGREHFAQDGWEVGEGEGGHGKVIHGLHGWARREEKRLIHEWPRRKREEF
jgi:hypothetical protein